MIIEEQLRERLRKVEALYFGAASGTRRRLRQRGLKRSLKKPLASTGRKR
jgi:hypothetical protein